MIYDVTTVSTQGLIVLMKLDELYVYWSVHFCTNTDGSTLLAGDVGRWLYVSAAQTSTKCGDLVSGKHLHFSDMGVRQAVTQDLDLTMAKYVTHPTWRG